MSMTNIHQAIIAVMSSVGYVQKESSPKLSYTYASETAVIRALRPAMISNGIYCYVAALPESAQDTFATAKGSVMNRTVTHGIVRFVHAPSDTFIEVHAVGEGMDTGDKSANKAATGLLKYALRQTFLIETGDDPDGTPSEEQERATAASSKEPPSQRPAFSAEQVRQYIWRIIEKDKDSGEIFSEELRDQIIRIIGEQLSALDADALQAGLDVFEYFVGNRDLMTANGLVWQAIWRWLALYTKDGILAIGRAQAVEEIGNVYRAYTAKSK